MSFKPSQCSKINLTTGKVITEDNKDVLVKQTCDMKIGNWVIVPFSGKCQIKYFAGQIIGKEQQTMKVKFLQKKGKLFKWPIVDDISDVDIDIINIIKLPEPSFVRWCFLSFKNFDFSNYLMG